MRDAIIEPVLIRDILGVATVNKPALFRQTFGLAMGYPAQEVSLQKLLGRLQETGNVTTIKHYLELLEGDFLLRVLPKYSGSQMRQRASSPKLVPLSTALVHAFRSPAAVDKDPEWRGRVLEAAVGAALTRSRGSLFYWRQGGLEVDYVLDREGVVYGIEIKSGRRRSSRGLPAFLDRYPGAVPVIVERAKAEELLAAPDVDAVLADGR
ncbi:MAG: DUF4143 domain-containing protein [Thermodesulfobacteriota bacterium]